eukprot:5503760-Pyramimonas_sp.AAC.1
MTPPVAGATRPAAPPICTGSASNSRSQAAAMPNQLNHGPSFSEGPSCTHLALTTMCLFDLLPLPTSSCASMPEPNQQRQQRRACRLQGGRPYSSRPASAPPRAPRGGGRGWRRRARRHDRHDATRDPRTPQPSASNI